jgi:hypothetical protein
MKSSILIYLHFSHSSPFTAHLAGELLLSSKDDGVLVSKVGNIAQNLLGLWARSGSLPGSGVLELESCQHGVWGVFAELDDLP